LNRTATAFVLALALLPGLVSAQNAASAGTASGLSDAGKLEQSAGAIARMKIALKRVLGRVAEARNAKDIVKLNCVNEKLTQLKVLLDVAEQADLALHDAVGKKDPGADAELSKIGIARTKIDGLSGEADQCTGQLAYSIDDRTTVEVQQPDGLPEQDVTARPAQTPAFVAPPVVRPPPASPFQ
jgi:hypothetical protein